MSVSLRTLPRPLDQLVMPTAQGDAIRRIVRPVLPEREQVVRLELARVRDLTALAVLDRLAPVARPA